MAQDLICNVGIVIGILKKFGNINFLSFSSDFKQRLIAQKTAYFLKLFGIPIEYSFSWYLHGPYSPNLTRDIYEQLSNIEKIPEIDFVNEDFDKCFKDCLAFLGPKKNDARWLEMAASIDFLKRVFPKESDEEIMKRLEAKPLEVLKEEFYDVLNKLTRVNAK